MKPHQSFTDTHDNSETPESQGLNKMGDFYYMLECEGLECEGPERFYAKREYCEDTDTFVWQCEYECNGLAECDFRFTKHQRWRLVTENELRVLCRNTRKKVYTITDTDTKGRAMISSCTPVIDTNGIVISVLFILCDTLNFPKPPEIPQVTEQVSESGLKLPTHETKDVTDPLAYQVGGSHYNSMKIQPVQYIVANDIPYREANVIKYVSRHRTKNGIEDLKKARQYIDMLIHEYENKNN